ncbi:MAG TPA: trehalase family glycosidase [Terriglobia bacterium]|nr:trehalase family glycosidase [Terriglobia bacterium]
MAAFLLALVLLCFRPPSVGAARDEAAGQNYSDVLQYISDGWTTLTRSTSDCNSVVDPKFPERSVLYLPADFPEPPTLIELQKTCSVRVEHLPAVIHHVNDLDTSKLQPGLLYLPNSYVVPGGMFNEMYGWDSYFIIRGLLQDGRLDLARGMVDNFFFEIAHYGDILNSNRTYHLTRSQPPFLTAMVRAVYEADAAQGHRDHAWLERAYANALTDYRFWTRAPHLAGETGLSRYYDLGEGPVPEVGAETETYYRSAVSYFLAHPTEADGYMVKSEGHAEAALTLGPAYSVWVCNESAAPPAAGATAPEGCDTVETLHLSRDFFKGDRSVRESGFDISFRFGPFAAATHHYAAVCLNSLLYKTELDLAWMSRELGHPQDVAEWEGRARARRAKVNQYLWNPGQGLYFDYDFEKGKQSSYVYATTFYPLWAGLASADQARAVAGHFRMFDEPGGIVTSREKTGAQWDYPYGWAPLQLIAVEGLRRYGDTQDADLASRQFLSMVAENFRRDKTIKEKYNVVTRSSETQVAVGYPKNQVGFGWTNGAFVTLLHEISAHAALATPTSGGHPRGTQSAR